MTYETLAREVAALPVADRFRLLDSLWDWMSGDSDEKSLLLWQEAMIDQRLADYERDPEAGEEKSEVIRQLRTGSGPE